MRGVRALRGLRLRSTRGVGLVATRVAPSAVFTALEGVGSAGVAIRAVSSVTGVASHAAASSETTLGLLQLIEGRTGGCRVLSSSGNLVRLDLPGPVAVGLAVDFGGGAFGVVLRYDRHGAVAALLTGPVPRSGSVATLRGTLAVQLPRQPLADSALACGVIEDFLVSAEASGLRPIVARTGDAEGDVASSDGTAPLLRLPAAPHPPQRRPVSRRLPSGLAAVEALLPLGEGHRIGLVGQPGSGKSTAARFIMASQAPDTACVYAALRPMQRLKAELAHLPASGSPFIAICADPMQHSAVARYSLPLCAMQLAAQLRTKHRHVLLVLDDLSMLAEAASELGVPPYGAPHLLAAALDAAGPAVGADGEEHTLTTVAVLDLDPDDELPPALRELWRGAEPSLDVRVGFSAQAALDGVLPAIDVDHLLGSGLVAPAYQAPLLRQLRTELAAKLKNDKELQHRLTMCKQLGFQPEDDEEDELAGAKQLRALLAHSAARPLPELVVILCAALVLHFPRLRCSSREIAHFQAAIVATVREDHPGLWEALGSIDTLDDAGAAELLQSLGEAIFLHRFDFRLTRPEL